MNPSEALSERRLKADLAGTAFQLGVARGWWRLESVAFPTVVVSVAASALTYERRWVGLKVDASGYPDNGLTACPWDVEQAAILAVDRRPSGGRASMTFRGDWENGRALYLPCDRIALAGHPDWATQHRDALLRPGDGIARFLRIVHTILTEADDASTVDAA